ncbi:hypothetical protein [Mesorhizobium sp.]|uniref:hypothetical protein n=1 Tax=Mesorhizobium sp. TaxID=1871066 RepID=UPI000FE78499|nr:hypothetical protein [Mesorhizobium sp.]RWD66020.1 MAG: hypothetical protein EOS37_25035 [Mesorhizobium sp.]TIV58469.1 MAG: hypothetical protein E5V80_18385 [Mesorhizobium sp.]
MNRYREFRGTFTRMEYDAEHGTFEWVAEVHPFLASMGAGVEIAADPQVKTSFQRGFAGRSKQQIRFAPIIFSIRQAVF